MGNNITGIDNVLSRFSKIENLRSLATVNKNWHETVMFRFGVKKEMDFALRSGKSYHLRNMGELLRLWDSPDVQFEFFRQMGINAWVKGDSVSFNFKGKRVRLYADKSQLGHALTLIRELFFYEYEHYKFLDIKGKTVVDIGANIGDSPIYFCLNGAKQVYAYEPFPHSYAIAKKNIRANGLGGRIELVNEGLGGKRQTMKVSSGFKSTPSSRLTNERRGTAVKVITLKDVVDRHKIGRNALLKMDCEGAEYDIILNAPIETLRKFDQILVQYHYGYVDIKKRLIEAGFRVINSVPMHYNGFGTGKSTTAYTGFLYGKLRA
ncbi:MAG: FkbM family methyltransferase [Candidatus Micrarchaeota archaeon]|nr:FkbM family methyltransferase [Candidatus Micrarchaeota archaeon]